MTKIEEGVVAIIPAPQRGRAAEPIPGDLVAAVLDSLGKIKQGQVVSTGRFFEKNHQAQAYRNRLIQALAEADEELEGRLGASVLPVDPEDRDEKGRPKGPFVLAVRKER